MASLTAPPPKGTLEVLFVGNATLLIRYGDLTLLTDPNFLHRGQHAHLGYGLVSRRLTEPALDPRDLPAHPNAVVLSHLHGDHWDRIARHHLDRGLPILTTPHASRRLQGLHGFHRAVGLRTWQSDVLVRGGSSVRVTALPARHAGNRLLRGLLPPVMGSLLEFGPTGHEPELRMYVSGDTLMFDGIRAIARHEPEFDLAAVHLGGTTLPGGFLASMDAAQGADLVEALHPRRVLPVHYEDYTVMRSPLADFEAEMRRRGLGDRLIRCGRGQRLRLDASGDVEVAPAPPPRRRERPTGWRARRR
ncbi:MBL fold metallo-hydrolase [Allostreptomyces psammosilenae]|uniref:L-ascorbate metabolism protein UlaG (Beta-lactamase superfamily) n=1 Tax=Allostreptomyces psammosilenae TaxID=1892865 RepID=A0A852ZZV5_9ACTN|nr:MBL fold metallo-hydrolase [Allostreptomyces psammosilenae]NYI07866.1 L-ascorbate metabolism protein UlaG (beta-lactamase superfamily) [Allostreptomyces psammosilenae]